MGLDTQKSQSSGRSRPLLSRCQHALAAPATGHVENALQAAVVRACEGGVELLQGPGGEVAEPS